MSEFKLVRFLLIPIPLEFLNLSSAVGSCLDEILKHSDERVCDDGFSDLFCIL
jgi:hypothetical protein